jgi:hypothetical protein
MTTHAALKTFVLLHLFSNYPHATILIPKNGQYHLLDLTSLSTPQKAFIHQTRAFIHPDSSVYTLSRFSELLKALF